MSNCKRLVLLLIVLLLPTFASCEKRESERMVYAMDTLITFKTSESYPELEAFCDNMIASIDSLISKTREGSDVYRFNRGERVTLSVDTNDLLTRVLELCRLTEGAYDPTVGLLCELWDITGDARVPGEDEINEAVCHIGYDKLVVENGQLYSSDMELKLDLGGAGKGYTLEKLIEILSESQGYGLVSFGSSIGVYGTKPDGKCWNIAITDPYNPKSTVGYVSIDEGFISVSGDYERYAEIDGKRYCHIIDPKTGYPVSNGVHSVVVYTKDAVVGDVISTALMVSGEQGIEKFKQAGIEFEAFIISDSGYTSTENMKKILTIYEEKK